MGIAEVVERVFGHVRADVAEADWRKGSWGFGSRPLKEFAWHGRVRRCWADPAKKIYLSHLFVEELTFIWRRPRIEAPAWAYDQVASIVFNVYPEDPCRYDPGDSAGNGLAAILRAASNVRSLTMIDDEMVGCVFTHPAMEIALRNAFTLRHVRLVMPDGASQAEKAEYLYSSPPCVEIAALIPGLRSLDISFDVGYEKPLPTAGIGFRTLTELRLAVEPGWDIDSTEESRFRTDIDAQSRELLIATLEWLVEGSSIRMLSLEARRADTEVVIGGGAERFGEAFAAGVLPKVAGTLTHLRLVDDSAGRGMASGLVQHLPALVSVEILELGGFKVGALGLDRMQPKELRTLSLAIDDAADAELLQLVEDPMLGRLRALRIAAMQPTDPSRYGNEAEAKALEHSEGFRDAIERACSKRDISLVLA